MNDNEEQRRSLENHSFFKSCRAAQDVELAVGAQVLYYGCVASVGVCGLGMGCVCVCVCVCVRACVCVVGGGMGLMGD